MGVEVFFDYTCGFSNRARHWLDGLESAGSQQFRWRPFSLLQRNHGRDGAPVFDRAEYADNVSLVALAVHMAVLADGGDLDGYRRRMFTAWHEEPGRLSTTDIVGFGHAHGLGDFDRPTAFAALAADHAHAHDLGVFGTPTLVFGASHAGFVALDAVPATDEAQPLLDQLRQLTLMTPPVLRQYQRVTPTGDS
jgi:predicted DsbA family dithiol-disulfide isomerase